MNRQELDKAIDMAEMFKQKFTFFKFRDFREYVFVIPKEDNAFYTFHNFSDVLNWFVFKEFITDNDAILIRLET